MSLKEKLKDYQNWIKSYMNLYPIAARRARKGMVGVGGLLVLAGAYKSLFGGEIVFDSILNEQKVKYVESAGIFGDYNYMSVKKNGIEYVFYDTSGGHTIKWREIGEQDFQHDELERFDVKKGSREFSYTRDNIGENTIFGNKASEVFKKADKFYNRHRTAIRDEKQTEENEVLDEILSGLSE